MPVRTRFLLTAVAVVGALALASCSNPAPSSRAGTTFSTGAARTTTTPTTTRTQEVRFDPYATDGTVLRSERVTNTVSGTCSAPGVAGASSYRCIAPEGGVYDPCFAPPRATSGPLLCVADPTSPDAVTFDTGALPAQPSGAPATRPWAIRLSEGQVCVLVDAAWGGLGPFACPTPGSATSPVADCHVPVSASPWWRVDCQAQQASSSAYAPYRVVTVWR